MKAASRLCTFSLLALALGACSSSGKSGAALRKEGYDAIVRNIKPGMYRRQLYALLPPARTSEAQPPELLGIIGIALYTEHREKHDLDDECYLNVRYQLKNGKDYANPRYGKSVQIAPKGKLPPGADSIDALLNPSPYEIDLLLDSSNRFKPGVVPSRENPDDIITSISTTLLVNDPVRTIDFGTTVSPTQDSFRFGRDLSRTQTPTKPATVADDFPLTVPRLPPGKRASAHRSSESPITISTTPAAVASPMKDPH